MCILNTYESVKLKVCIEERKRTLTFSSYIIIVSGTYYRALLTSTPTIAPVSSNSLHVSESPVVAASIRAIWPVLLGRWTRAPLSSSKLTISRRVLGAEVALQASTSAGSLVGAVEHTLGSAPDESNLRTTCKNIIILHSLWTKARVQGILYYYSYIHVCFICTSMRSTDNR